MTTSRIFEYKPLKLLSKLQNCNTESQFEILGKNFIQNELNVLAQSL